MLGRVELRLHARSVNISVCEIMEKPFHYVYYSIRFLMILLGG